MQLFGGKRSAAAVLHARERLRRSDLSGALTLPSTGGALALSAAAALTLPQIAAPDSSSPLRTPSQKNCQMPSAREALPYLHLFLIFVCFKEKSNLKISTRRTHLNEKGTCRIDVCEPGTRSPHVPSQRDA